MAERRYIDLDALIDVELFDDEHEDWNWHRMTVCDYLNIACDNLPSVADVVDGSTYRDCRNELCLRCGQYRLRYKGACDGCRWMEVQDGG